MFLDIETLKDEEKNIGYVNLEKIKRLEPFEVHNAKFEEVEINHAVGMVSKDFIVPYPPGIPLVLPGEEITEDVVKAIRWYQGKCISVLGVYYNRIKVVLD